VPAQGSPTEYILTSDDTAMRVRGSDEEAAVTVLEARSCRHLDANALGIDHLVERMPRHRSQGRT
jgi:hypothetical protein